jgi:quinol-cytochrome oxidoreductase complex cytochrome b subunit
LKNFSTPVKIGVIILFVGMAVMAYGTYLNSENISYYALLIIITGLFIYMAYTFNFVGKSNVNYSNKEKEKKKKK